MDTCVGGFSVELPGVSPTVTCEFFSVKKSKQEPRPFSSKSRTFRNRCAYYSTTETHIQSRRSDLFLTGPRIEFSSCMVHAVGKRGQVHFSPSSSLSILFFRPVYAARVSQISFLDHLKGALTNADQP